MQHKIVSRDEWIAARRAFLKNEKAFTKALDTKRRAARPPWVKVEKDYVFDTSDGKKGLADLFYGRSQRIVYTSCSGLIGARAALAARILRIISMGGRCFVHLDVT
jgi:predicted dithiol-disulfide oxidoreductase (DUF899 family)